MEFKEKLSFVLLDTCKQFISISLDTKIQEQYVSFQATENQIDYVCIIKNSEGQWKI